MFTTGPGLVAGGIRRHAAMWSKRRPRPQLRLFGEASARKVGVQQLANVRWSVFFDDMSSTRRELRGPKEARRW